MDEKKEQNEKLTYEQLENAARQLSAQFDSVVRENQQLKTLVQKLQLDNMFTELNFRFKVLDHAELFNDEFVDRILGEIEDIMTIKEEEAKDEK